MHGESTMLRAPCNPHATAFDLEQARRADVLDTTLKQRSLEICPIGQISADIVIHTYFTP
jgi:hypothetical protein